MGGDLKVGRGKNFDGLQKLCRKSKKIAEIDPVRNLSNQKQGQLIDLASDARLEIVLNKTPYQNFRIRPEAEQLFFFPFDFGGGSCRWFWPSPQKVSSRYRRISVLVEIGQLFGLTVQSRARFTNVNNYFVENLGRVACVLTDFWKCLGVL